MMELVNPKDKDYISETVTISRRYHRTLLGEKAIFIHDIESKTSSSVRFPARESASDLVTIFGPSRRSPHRRTDAAGPRSVRGRVPCSELDGARGRHPAKSSPR